MAITKLGAVPTSGQRIGGMSVRLEPLASPTAYFITPDAASVPDMGNDDFLIFGRADFLSGSGTASPNLFCIGTSLSNTEFRVQLSTASSWLAFLWADAGTNWTGTASYSGLYPRMGGALHWFCLRNGDDMVFGFLDQRTGAITKATATKPGGHGGRWSQDLVDAGTAGAARMVIGARYVSSTASSIVSFHSGHVTFCRCASGVSIETTGIDPADGGFDALITSIMLDPQRINEFTWTAGGVYTFGDVTRGATTAKLGQRYPERLWDGDRITCPRTSKYLSLTGSSLNSSGGAVGSRNDAWVYPPYTQPAAQPQQGQQKDSAPLADKLAGGAYAFIEMPRCVSGGTELLVGFLDPSTGLPCRWPITASPYLKLFNDSTGATTAASPWRHAEPFSGDNHWGGVVMERSGDMIVAPSFHSDVTTTGFNSVTNQRGIAITQFLRVQDDPGQITPTFVDIGTEPWDTGLAYSGNEDTYQRWAISYVATGRMTIGATTWALGINRHQDTSPGFLGAWQYNGTDAPTWVRVTAEPASGEMKGGIPIAVVPLDSEHCLLTWNPRPVIAGSSRGSVGAMGFVCKPGSGFATNTNWYAPRTGVVCDGASGRPTLGSIEPGDERFLIDPQNLDALEADDLSLGETVGTYKIIGHNGTIAMCSTVFSTGSLDDAAADAYDNPTTAKIHVMTWNPSTKTLGNTVTVDLTSFILADRGDNGAPPWMTLQFTDVQRKGAVLLYASGTTQQVAGTDFSFFEGLWGSRISAIYFPDIKGDPTRYVPLGTIYDCTVSGGLSVTVLSLGRSDDWSDKALIQVHGRVVSSSLSSVGTSLIDLSSLISQTEESLAAQTQRGGWLSRKRE